MEGVAVQPAAAGSDLVDPRVVTLSDPGGAAAEQFRILHLRLERVRQMRPLCVVAITSAVPGEGKSLTAANLAAIAAQRTPRVLLVDGDLRRGTQRELFGAADGPGLAQVLEGSARLEEAIRVGPGGLALIPAGRAEQDPAQLLSGPPFRALLDRLRGAFQEIYLDLPPALAFADAQAAAAAADGVLVVVQSGETQAELVAQAIEALAGASLVGCVLTGHGETAAVYRRYAARR